jgi:hypothetical protein
MVVHGLSLSKPRTRRAPTVFHHRPSGPIISFLKAFSRKPEWNELNANCHPAACGLANRRHTNGTKFVIGNWSFEIGRFRNGR